MRRSLTEKLLDQEIALMKDDLQSVPGVRVWREMTDILVAFDRDRFERPGMFRLSCNHFDAQPPSVAMLDPESRVELPLEAWTSGVPHSVHPLTNRPFVCPARRRRIPLSPITHLGQLGPVPKPLPPSPDGPAAPAEGRRRPVSIYVARAALEGAGSFFESAGAFGREGTGMLGGRIEGTDWRMERFFAPDQRGGEYPTCWVEVTRLGKQQLALALDVGERWLARIHSHPAQAFHSSTDDANPGLTAEGAVSIVVPFFGLGLRGGIGACALFQRRGRRSVATSAEELDVRVIE